MHAGRKGKGVGRAWRYVVSPIHTEIEDGGEYVCCVCDVLLPQLRTRWSCCRSGDRRVIHSQDTGR